MPAILSKSICYLYSVAIAAFGLAMVMFPWNIIAVIGLWASALGLALRFRWAFGIAYAVALLNVVAVASNGLGVRLPLSGIFRENLARHYLLESPAQFFNWYGIPKPVSQIALCMLAIALLAMAHATLARKRLLRPLNDRDGKLLFARIGSILSKLTLAVALIVIAYAFWKDPPTGGRNPGGPGPGILAFLSLIVAGPWAIAGAGGWALAARLRRSAARTTQLAPATHSLP